MAFNSWDYDRAKAVQEFDATKSGVKGLVDSGATTIPRFFVHPSETLSSLRSSISQSHYTIPSIDLSELNSDHRPDIIKQVCEASRTLGFFQIINHGVATSVLDETIASVKAFHEQPAAVKAHYYDRKLGNDIAFISNFDLFFSKAANWLDTLRMKFGPVPAQVDRIPEICRKELVAWDSHVKKLAESVMELLSEGLGLDPLRLKEMSCSEGRSLVAHYYPYCPQPDLTVGINGHTDISILTVLLQDQIGGLQVKHGDEWADVKPIHGALVINIGDVLQMISNNEYKSVEHRVLANPSYDPRISIAVFFQPGKIDDHYGPLPELVSPQKPAIYRNFTVPEIRAKFFTKELGGDTLINNFKF